MSTPFVPALNTCKCEMRYTQQGQQVENTFYFNRGLSWNPTDMLTLAAALKAWHTASLKSLQVNEVQLQSVVVTDLTTQTSPGIEYSTGLPVSGTNGTDPLPMNVTLALKMLTEFRGRSYRGRVYHIGLAKAMFTGSTLAPTSVSPMLAGWGALIVAGASTSSVLSVVSRRHDKAWRANAVITPVVQFALDVTADSQRRRLPGRGR